MGNGNHIGLMTATTMLDIPALDKALGDLRASAPGWVDLPLNEKVALLEALLRASPAAMSAEELLAQMIETVRGVGYRIRSARNWRACDREHNPDDRRANERHHDPTAKEQ